MKKYDTGILFDYVKETYPEDYEDRIKYLLKTKNFTAENCTITVTKLKSGFGDCLYFVFKTDKDIDDDHMSEFCGSYAYQMIANAK